MLAYRLTALVTLAMLVTYFWTAFLVGRGRGTHQVKAPATEGPDAFNRIYRAHVNTLEQLVLMLPAVWLFAIAGADRWAALAGVVWIVGRVIYVTSYVADPTKRGTGFMISFGAWAVCVIGALVQLLRTFG